MAGYREVSPSGAPLAFYTERRLVVLTGRKARDLRELLCHLRQVSGSSVFYHTHYLYLIHHFEKPKFYNEFAEGVSEALQEKRLAEQLAAIDLLSITSIQQIREALIALVEKHIPWPAQIPQLPRPARWRPRQAAASVSTRRGPTARR